MDSLTLNKMREVLEGAKGKIGQIEMRATPVNIEAVNTATGMIQIVINTISVELAERDKTEKEGKEHGTESDAK